MSSGSEKHRSGAKTSSNVSRVNTDEVISMGKRPDVRIIDVRSANAYNGWPERGESRGGHIRGARSLPAKWADYIDWIEIVRSKDLRPGHDLVVYGYDRDQAERVAGLFKRAGYSSVSIYNGFMDEWAADGHPMDRLPRYQHLVSAEWLHDLIGRQETGEAGDSAVICHAHYRNRADYERGHIPGAVDVDTNLLESTETWNRRSPEELQEALQGLGITHDTTVVLYGRFSQPDSKDPFPGSSAGHLGAMRCAFIMMYAGVEDVRILNGGVQSWIDAGFELTTDETSKVPVDDFGVRIPQHPGYAVDLPQAKEILDDPDKNLVCMRSWREYIGEVSGYNYIEKKGRIPGSVFADCGSDPYHLENYRNLDHTTREYHQIAENWAQCGITPEKMNAFYCGTGWRASEAFFNAWLMDWPNIAVFDGGWFEWSNNNCPFETGEPE